MAAIFVIDQRIPVLFRDYNVYRATPITDMGLGSEKEAVYIVVEQIQAKPLSSFVIANVARRQDYKIMAGMVVSFNFSVSQTKSIQKLLAENGYGDLLEMDIEKLRYIFVVPAEYFAENFVH